MTATSTTQRPWRSAARRGWRAAAAAAVIASLLPLAGTGAPARAAEPQPGMRVVGRMPVLYQPTSNGTYDAFLTSTTGKLILNPTTRRAYQIFENQSPPTMWIQSFDLDTLRPVRRVELPGHIPLGATVLEVTGEVVHAVDEAGGRLFLPVATGNLTNYPVTTDAQRILDHVVVIDEAAFDAGAATFSRRFDIPLDQRPLIERKGLRGLTYFGGRGEGRLLALFAAIDQRAEPLGVSRPFDHQLVQWGVDRASDNWSNAALLARPQACGRAPLTAGSPRMYPLGILRTRTSVFVGCQQGAGVATVVGFPLATTGPEAGKPDITAEPEHSPPLPRFLADVLVDPGSERLFVRSVLGGTSWWTYDTRTRTWAGAMGASQSSGGDNNSAGIDPATGRFYALVPDHVVQQQSVWEPVRGGFRFADARLSPVPQLTDAPGIGEALAYPGMFRIAVDPAGPGRPRRVFLRRGHFNGDCFYDKTRTVGSPCKPLIHHEYLVIEDTVPVSVQPGAGEVDRYTTNVEEQAGRTDANYDGAAQGFGFRTRLTGGLSGATTREADGTNTVTHGSGCLPADRVLTFGAVDGTQLSNVQTAAGATAADADATTRLDAENPAVRCWPAPFAGPGLVPVMSLFPKPPGSALQTGPWQDVATECTDDGKHAGRGSGARAEFFSHATCDRKTSTVAADARAPLGFQGAVLVAESGSKATVRREPGTGLVSTVEAWARGVDIPGVGRIEQVRATATSKAGGRPGGAKGTFTRTLCGIDIAPVTRAGCTSDGTVEVGGQKVNLVKLMNDRFAGRGEARLRSPDGAYLAGSPGGYQAAVQRDRLESFADTVISRDASLAVPGLEIVIYRDNAQQGAARQIFQFAAVQASSQYGIYCLHGNAENGKSCAAPAGGFDASGGGEPTFASDAPAGLFAAQLDGSGLGGGTTGPAAIELTSGKGRGGLLDRLLAVPADVLRLLFSNPRELALMATVWALVWLPCYLGERRRALSAAVSGIG